MSAGDTVIRNSILYQNTAGSGAGIHNTYWANLVIEDSQVIANQAQYSGGGIFNTTATVTIRNSVFYDNAVLDATNGTGAAISNVSTGNVTLVHVSIYANRARPGFAGIYNENINDSKVFIENSLLAQNQGGNCRGTAPISQGYNLEDTFACNFTAEGDQSNSVIQLTLPENGAGLPALYSLELTSPAIDAIPAGPEQASCLPTDIRGAARPIDGDGDGLAYCDIGALEFAPPAVGILQTGVAMPGQPIELTAKVFQITATTPITYIWEANQQAVITHTNDYHQDAISYTWPSAGSQYITVTAINKDGLLGTASHLTEVFYTIFVPSIFRNNPWPLVGFWQASDAPSYFYVTNDRRYIDQFSHFEQVPGCGYVRVYISELLPIQGGYFSFDGPFHGYGSFTSETRAEGIYELTNLPIGYPCDVIINDGPYYWHAELFTLGASSKWVFSVQDHPADVPAPAGVAIEADLWQSP